MEGTNCAPSCIVFILHIWIKEADLLYTAEQGGRLVDLGRKSQAALIQEEEAGADNFYTD